MWWFNKGKYFSLIFWQVVILMAMFPLLASCGYRFVSMDVQGPTRDVSPTESFHSIAIPISRANSTFPGIEADFATAFREEFVSRSGLRLVSQEDADVVLEAQIAQISTTPSAYSVKEFTVGALMTKYETTSKRTLVVRLKARLMHKRSGRIIWEDPRMEERGSYRVGADPLVNIHNERKAYVDIARRLARRIFLRSLERF